MILSEYEWQAVELSLKVSGLAVVCSLPFGILMAWVLVRCRFPGKALLDGVIHLPLVLPPVVVGYLLLIAMGRRGVIGEWLYDWFGFSFSFSWRGAALASAVVAFPLMVRAIRLALEAVDTRLEQAARTLGANPWRVFSPSRCRCRCPASLSAWCWPSPARWGSSAPPSPSSPTFPVKPAPFRWRCIR